MSWKAKAPSLVVTVLWSIPVVLSVAFTVALGTTAPEGSVTVPLMAPRNVWAFAATASERATRIAKTRRFIGQHPPYRDQKNAPTCRHSAARFKVQDVKLLEKLHGEPFAFGFKIQT